MTGTREARGQWLGVPQVSCASSKHQRAVSLPVLGCKKGLKRHASNASTLDRIPSTSRSPWHHQVCPLPTVPEPLGVAPALLQSPHGNILWAKNSMGRGVRVGGDICKSACLATCRHTYILISRICSRIQSQTKVLALCWCLSVLEHRALSHIPMQVTPHLSSNWHVPCELRYEAKPHESDSDCLGF